MAVINNYSTGNYFAQGNQPNVCDVTDSRFSNDGFCLGLPTNQHNPEIQDLLVKNANPITLLHGLDGSVFSRPDPTEVGGQSRLLTLPIFGGSKVEQFAIGVV